ncbi:MAG: hypothetical protein IPK99_02550 [Flavobacteriales bacterium]|nr:hypothetical protein [Flavobacteriales bacterium]
MDAMKKAVVVLSIALCAGATAQDQEPITPEMRAKMTATSLMGSLGLSPEQARGVQAELIAGESEVSELRAQCEKLQAELDRRMAPYYETAGRAMTKEQNEQFTAMVARGDLRCPSAYQAVPPVKADDERTDPAPVKGEKKATAGGKSVERTTIH